MSTKSKISLYVGFLCAFYAAIIPTSARAQANNSHYYIYTYTSKALTSIYIASNSDPLGVEERLSQQITLEFAFGSAQDLTNSSWQNIITNNFYVVEFVNNKVNNNLSGAISNSNITNNLLLQTNSAGAIIGAEADVTYTEQNRFQLQFSTTWNHPVFRTLDQVSTTSIWTDPIPGWEGRSLLNYNSPGTWSVKDVGTYMELDVTAAVPEPETFAMLLAGLGLFGAIGSRKRADTPSRIVTDASR